MQDRTKWIVPLFVLGTLLGVVGIFSLINRFQNGFMSEGLLRYGCWFIICMSIAGAIGCFGQALEWRRAAASPLD